MITRRQLLIGGGALLTVGAGVGAGCTTIPEPDKPLVHPLTGLSDFAGAPVETPRILGTVTIVDFWASWCGPCRQAFRYMDQLYRTYQGDGLEMIGVSVDEDAVAAKRFWAMAKPRFPVAWDGGGEVRERFSVSSLPTTVLFDPQGFLVQRNEGFDPADHRILEEHVHRLLRG